MLPIEENKRSNLKDSDFGIPEDRKFPLDTEQHVISAIKLFGHAEESKKKSLAKNIKKAADKYNIDIPETTQCYKYLNESVLSSDKEKELKNKINDELKEKEYSSFNDLCNNIKSIAKFDSQLGIQSVMSVKKYNITAVHHVNAFYCKGKEIYKVICEVVPLIGGGLGKIKCSSLKSIKFKPGNDINNIFKVLKMCDNTVISTISAGKNSVTITLDIGSKQLASKLNDKFINVKTYLNGKIIKVVNNNIKESSIYEVDNIEDNIDTIIFDFGDVLVGYDDYKIKAKEYGIPEDYIEEIFNLSWHDLPDETETCSLDRYVEIVQERVSDNAKPYVKQFLLSNAECAKQYDYTVELLNTLKFNGYKLYYLSNWCKWNFEALKEKGVFSFINLFDGGIVSYECGMLKPNHKIYNLLIDSYDINPSTAIFYDDKKENVEAAKECGLNAVIFNKDCVDSIINKKPIETDNDTDSVISLLDSTSYDHIYCTSDWHMFKNHYKKEKNLVNTKDIIKWCKENIGPNDIFMYLGDLCYRWAGKKDNDKVKEIIKSLPGKKILILGNHDIVPGPEFYGDCGFDYVFEKLEYKNIIFTHRPIDMGTYNDNYINIHGHIHDIKEYHTTDGKKNINVYPYFYNNHPAKLSYLLDNKEKLTKDNFYKWNVMLGECTDMIDSLLENKETEISEWAMNACNPIVGIHKPFIVKIGDKSESLINAKQYALADDLIPNKYLVINEDSKLEIKDSDYIDDKIIESVYEFIGPDYMITKLAKSYCEGSEVTSIYTCLTDKPLVSIDQIDYDENFKKIDFNMYKDSVDTKLATMQEQWDIINNENIISFPVIESAKITENYDHIKIMNNINGYYCVNKLSGNRTKYVNHIGDITESMLKTII